MRASLYLCVSLLLVGAAWADSILELGFQLTPSQPAVEWKEGIVINMTCKSECIRPCTVCSSFKYVIEKRNKTYLPSVPSYDDFRMHEVVNLTGSYQSRCRFEQTVSMLKVQKTESGTVRCISMANQNVGGIAFIYIFYNATFTNATLPTEVTAKDIDMDAGGKVSVKVRAFNTTADGDNVPYVSCSVIGGSTGTTFQWSWANNTKLATDQAIETSPVAGGGSSTQMTSKLTFKSFAEKAVQIVGVYKCLIEASTVQYPVLFSAPVVKMSDKDYRSSMEGDTMTQGCNIVAYPDAVVTWSKDNQTLIDDDRIKFGADNATLTITSLKQEDAGLYICTAENSLGVGQAYIKLRVKDRLAALWPFLGILAEVIILVTIILLYEKKRAAQKRSQEEQDAAAAAADNKEDRNANDSDVRHRPVKT